MTFALTNRLIHPRVSPVRGPFDSYVSPWEFIGCADTTQLPLAGPTTAAAPGGIQANDLIHISMFVSPNITAPTGYTEIFDGNIEAYWRVATADSNDDFVIPVGIDSETGSQVIMTVWRRPGEVPSRISSGATDQSGAGPMIIADMPFNQSGVNDTLLIATSNKTGTGATRVPIFTKASDPYTVPVGCTPIFIDWGVSPDRYATLATSFIFEETGSVKPGGTVDFSQDEGAPNRVSDSRSARFSIV